MSDKALLVWGNCDSGEHNITCITFAVGVQTDNSMEIAIKASLQSVWSNDTHKNGNPSAKAFGNAMVSATKRFHAANN